MLSNRIGTFNTIIPCTFICDMLILAWIAVHSTGALMAFAILYGFFSGSFVSLPPSTLVALFLDLSKFGTRIGMSFGFSGIGALLSLQTGHCAHMQIFCGVIMLIACVMLVIAHVAKSGVGIMVKA